MGLKIATTWVTIKEILLSKRFKAFYWTGGTMAFAWLLEVLIALAADLHMNTLTVTVLGLILAQVTKALNTSKS